jgi:hypothetical protein
MIWSTVAPTAAGIYWSRDTEGYTDVVWLEIHSGILLARYMLDSALVSINRHSGEEWADINTPWHLLND